MIPWCTWTPLSPGTVLVTRHWGKCASIQNIFKNYDEQAGARESGKGSRDKDLSDYQDGLETRSWDSNISPADKIWRTIWRPERLHIWLLRMIQYRFIININGGSLGVHRAQYKLQSRHTSVPREWNEDRSPITDEAYQERVWQRTIQKPEVH